MAASAGRRCCWIERRPEARACAAVRSRSANSICEVGDPRFFESLDRMRLAISLRSERRSVRHGPGRPRCRRLPGRGSRVKRVLDLFTVGDDDPLQPP